MKYLGSVTAVLMMLNMSAALAQTDTPPADAPAQTPPAAMVPPPPVTSEAPAAPTPPVAPAVQEPAPAMMPPPSAPAAAAPPSAPTVPAKVAPPVTEPTPPAAEEKPAAREEAPKKKKKAAPRRHARTHEEWPDSPALATRPQASSVAPSEDTAGAIPALPLTVMTNGLATYVTGGIGDEELSELRTVGSQFNMHLLFTDPTGAYVSEVMVRVLDDKGAEVLSVMNAGPYLYIKLSPGEYTIEATSSLGTVKSEKVAAPQKGFGQRHFTFAG